MLQIVIPVGIFGLSLVIMAVSGHFTIDALEKIIRITGLREASAGFIILAIMTSTPELAVALFSYLEGVPSVSIGDVLGSNVFNIGFTLGILGALGYLRVCCTDMLIELTDFLVISSMIPLLLVAFNILTPFVGYALFTIFIVNSYTRLKTEQKKPDPIPNLEPTTTKGKAKVITMLLIGFVGVVAAAQLVVVSGLEIATIFGIPPIIIGAKFIAIGTSLPELTLDIYAVRRGRVTLAIGDLVGSNLINLTLVLGLILITSPFAVNIVVFTEILPFLLITTILFWRLLIRGGVSRAGGVTLIIAYILFQLLVV
ncbi:MAG: sodium:calcium antiporter [Candidatus Ranarchaeia archaeon]